MLAAAERTEARPATIPTHVPPRLTRRDLLAWSLVTSGLFTAGGLWRVFRSVPIGPDELASTPPFSLDTIPRALDGWKSIDETQLDPITTRITGSTGYTIRTYSDELTGTTVTALILYGPADPVLPHTPQVCYPASGYRALVPPTERTIVVADARPAIFRKGFFGKAGGRSAIRQVVYHSYRFDGVWSPDVAERSLPRRWAGLYKVQIQRRVLDGERTDGDEPIESFLRVLLPAMERMIAAAPSTTAKQVAPVQA